MHVIVIGYQHIVIFLILLNSKYFSDNAVIIFIKAGVFGSKNSKPQNCVGIFYNHINRVHTG